MISNTQPASSHPNHRRHRSHQTVSARRFIEENLVGWRHSLGLIAYWISQIASPPILAAVAVLLSVAVTPSPLGWLCAALYITLTIVLPCAYIVSLVRRGKATDFHLPNRQERMRPLQITLALTTLAWILMLLLQAPHLLQVVALANFVQTLLFFVVTFYWKISLHSAAAAGLAALCLLISGALALPVLALVLLVGWSRLYLRRHTLSQITMGAIVGGLLLAGAAYYL